MKYPFTSNNDKSGSTLKVKTVFKTLAIVLSTSTLLSVGMYFVAPKTNKVSCSAQVYMAPMIESIRVPSKSVVSEKTPLSIAPKTTSPKVATTNVVTVKQTFTSEQLFLMIPEEEVPYVDQAIVWPSEKYSWCDYKMPTKTWPANPDMGAGENYPNIDKQANSEKVYTQGIPGKKAPVDFGFPVKNPEVSSYFGWRKTFDRIHYGIDFCGTTKTPVYAAARGTVTKWTSNNTGDFGKAIEIHHGDEFSTIYAHLSKILVEPGDHVEKGDLIGYMGNTGVSTGVHLHFELRQSAIAYNPFLGYLNHDEVK